MLPPIVCVVGRDGLDDVLNAPYGCHCPLLLRAGVDVKEYCGTGFAAIPRYVVCAVAGPGMP